MARQFNGTSDAASVPLDLSLYNTISVAFWLYWDAFASNDHLAAEYTSNYNSNNGFIIDPNSGTVFAIGLHGPSLYWTDNFARPSAAAWHHYMFVFDRSTPANIAYVDGVAQTLTTGTHNAGSYGNFANSTLYLMSRNASTLFAGGRMAEVAIWGGIQLGSGEAQALADYRSPLTISRDRLIAYMPLEGVSRERVLGPRGALPNIVTPIGTTPTAHPYGPLASPFRKILLVGTAGAVQTLVLSGASCGASASATVVATEVLSATASCSTTPTATIVETAAAAPTANCTLTPTATMVETAALLAAPNITLSVTVEMVGGLTSADPGAILRKKDRFRPRFRPPAL